MAHFFVSGSSDPYCKIEKGAFLSKKSRVIFRLGDHWVNFLHFGIQFGSWAGPEQHFRAGRFTGRRPLQAAVEYPDRAIEVGSRCRGGR